jgi:hypothetical protein
VVDDARGADQEVQGKDPVLTQAGSGLARPSVKGSPLFRSASSSTR